MPLLIFLLIMLCLTVVYSIKNGISPMPTTKKTKTEIMKLLPLQVRGKVYELGSGWGTLAFPIARQLPHTQVVGYENSPVPYLISKLRHWLFPLPNLTIERKDFFTVNLSDASLVVCYLYPGAMLTLKKKLERELKPGTWVVSNTFSIPGWNPIEERTIADIYRTKVFLYKIKLDKV